MVKNENYVNEYRKTDKYKQRIEKYKQSCIEARKKAKELKLKEYSLHLDLLLEHDIIKMETYDKIKKILSDTIERPCKTNIGKINLVMSLYDFVNYDFIVKQPKPLQKSEQEQEQEQEQK